MKFIYAAILLIVIIIGACAPGPPAYGNGVSVSCDWPRKGEAK